MRKLLNTLYITNEQAWLTLDGNPYPAIVEGKVVWIVDGYTTTANYPYAQLESLDDATSDSTTARATSVSAIRAGSADCAITGAVSGRTVGLPKVTKTLYTLPISWGLAVFGANREAWRALPADLRAIVLEEVPKLEATIWDEAERDTAVERLCAVAGNCALGNTEALTEVRPSQADQALRRRILEQNVLPQWIARCGANCQALWDANIAPVVGIKAPPFQ